MSNKSLMESDMVLLEQNLVQDYKERCTTACKKGSGISTQIQDQVAFALAHMLEFGLGGLVTCALSRKSIKACPESGRWSCETCEEEGKCCGAIDQHHCKPTVEQREVKFKEWTRKRMQDEKLLKTDEEGEIVYSKQNKCPNCVLCGDFVSDTYPHLCRWQIFQFTTIDFTSCPRFFTRVDSGDDRMIDKSCTLRNYLGVVQVVACHEELLYIEDPQPRKSKKEYWSPNSDLLLLVAHCDWLEDLPEGEDPMQGLFLLSPKIKKGSAIMLYPGLVVEAAEDDGVNNITSVSSDASVKITRKPDQRGGYAHKANQTCDPNMAVADVQLDGSPAGAFYALKDILPLQEMTWFYNQKTTVKTAAKRCCCSICSLLPERKRSYVVEYVKRL